MMISGLHLSAVFGFAAAETWTVRLSGGRRRHKDERQRRVAGALLELSTSGSHLLSLLAFPFFASNKLYLELSNPQGLDIECFQTNKTDKKNSRKE